MKAARHSLDGQKPIHIAHSYESGRAIVRVIGGSDSPPVDGIIFASATSAAGALLECRSAGIAVPQHLSIASLGDGDLAPKLDPPLTAVQVSRLELGQCAARIIIARLAGLPAPRHVRLEFSIALRGSH